MANGHRVKIVASTFREKPSVDDRYDGTTPPDYFAIRVYCTEQNLNNRLIWMEEFRAPIDFEAGQFSKIWEWLFQFSQTRAVFEYDGFDDLIGDLADVISRISAEGEDATQHYQHLPEINFPWMFDKFDDSIFNDQNDGETGRQPE